jgi:MFS family permease
MPPGSPATEPHEVGVARDSIWAAQRRALTVGLVLTITLVAFESLAVATVMPEVEDTLGGLGWYGWVFSGFFLASLVGIVLTGQMADRRGLALPFGLGLAFFTVGLIVGGAAPSMPVLVAGRLAQGFGAGAIPAVAYAAIGRGLPGALRPAMFATLSTAWVVPGLIGPAVASLVEHVWSWRVVFLGLVPFVVLAAAMTLPALAALDRAATATNEPLDRVRIFRVVVLVFGVGALFAAVDLPFIVGVALGVAGLVGAVWAFRLLQPPGTMRMAPGIPATVTVRGLLTWAFFAGDAYVSLAMTDGRGAETWVAGMALSAGAVCWTLGSWTQARLIGRLGPRRLVGVGMSIVAVGLAAMLLSLAHLPLAACIVAWGVAASGVGLSYPTLSVTVLGLATPGEEGAASAALQLSDTLGTAVGTGIGGAIIAIADTRNWAVLSSTTVVYVMALMMALTGVLASRRLPLTTAPSR